MKRFASSGASFDTSLASRRGGALVSSLLVAAALAAVAAAAFTMSLGQSNEVGTQTSELRAFYLAETGLSEAIRQVAVSVEQTPDLPIPAAIGSENAPISVKSGSYWATMVDNLDHTYTITATGLVGSARRRLQVVIEQAQGGVFDHAIFAGNSSGDPSYTLRLSGAGAEADEVVGDIYSGNDIEIAGNATVDGGAYATGDISGVTGTGGVTRPIPDIAGMHYEQNHDFDVAALFAAATPASNALGGTALQLSADSPGHIFRKNPSDRASEINGTPKDDYFLEDPYNPVEDFTAWNGQPGHTITLSGTMGAAGPSGTDKVYFIDGNLWVHNPIFYRLRFLNTDAAGVKVTFVVKGNVYFSDDVLLDDAAKDGVAFIAIQDEDEPDSGNVFLGDPRFGTLERMQAFLYAENDFHDYNLDAAGSKQVELFGNMTAGNHVSIERDFVRVSGTVVHSKLSVFFDDRLSTGALVLPGLPGPIAAGVGGMVTLFWREIAEE